MLPLWVFTDVLMKKMYISSICWHPLYPDLFAVGLSKKNGVRKLFITFTVTPCTGSRHNNLNI